MRHLERVAGHRLTANADIEQDGHDPTFLSNLSALGQVTVPQTHAGLFRSVRPRCALVPRSER